MRLAVSVALAAALMATMPSAAEASSPACAPVVVAVAPNVKLSGEPFRATVVQQQQPPVSSLLGAATTPAATIDVQYHDFPASLQAAFQAAVNTWARLISTPVPITVDATWGPTSNGDIATASPTMDLVPGQSVWYTQALADRLAGRSLDPMVPDITIVIDSQPPGGPGQWYTGLDGRPGPGQLDLPTAVLHELGHGLGIGGLFDVDPQGIGSVGGTTGTPSIFDSLVATAGGGLVTALANESSAMGAALEGGDLVFAGPQATLANGGHPPRLFSTPTWQAGSSVYHTSPVAFPPGSDDSLMDPAVHPGEAVHDPGPVIEGLLDDLGWSSVAGRPTALTAGVGSTGLVDVVWMAPAFTGGSPVTGYQVSAYDPGGNLAAQTTVPATGASSDATQLGGLAAGTTYRVEVRALNGVGAGSPAGPATVKVPVVAVTTSPFAGGHPPTSTAAASSVPSTTTVPPQLPVGGPAVTSAAATTSVSPAVFLPDDSDCPNGQPRLQVDSQALGPVESLPGKDESPSIVSWLVLAGGLIVGGQFLRRYSLRRGRP